MRSPKVLEYLSMMAVASINQSDNSDASKGSNSPTKSKQDLAKKYSASKQGMKRFRFEETGFTCEALNKKSAIKKHEVWKKSKSV